MKNLFLISVVFFFSENSFSQTIDTSFISVDTIELNISEDTIQIENRYQYRIIFNNSFDGYNETILIELLTDFFETKVNYDKNLNQFIIVSTKDIDQSNFARNFKQEISLFKRIPLISKLN